MQETNLARANEKMKSKGIMEGDLVLRYNSKLDKTFQKKFQVKWEGLFKVMKCFANGTYQLMDLDGTLHASRVNGLRLKKYCARAMTVSKDETGEEEEEPVGGMVAVDDDSLAMMFCAANHK